MIFEVLELSVALLGAPNLCLRIPVEVVFLFSAWGNMFIFSTSLLSFLDSYNELQLQIRSVISGCSYLYSFLISNLKTKLDLQVALPCPNGRKCPSLSLFVAEVDFFRTI